MCELALRHGAGDSGGLERAAEPGENPLQAAVQREGRRLTPEPRDLRHGQPVLEPEPKKEPVRRLKALERGHEDRVQIRALELEVGRLVGRRGDHSQTEFVAHQVGELAALRMPRAGLRGVSLLPAITLPVKIEAEPAGHHDEPGLEPAMALGAPGSKPLAAVAPQGLEHEDVLIHHSVVVAIDRAGDPQQQRGVLLEEAGPGRITIFGRPGNDQSTQ